MSFKIFSGTYKSSKYIKIETKNIYNRKDYLKKNKKKIKKKMLLQKNTKNKLIFHK